MATNHLNETGFWDHVEALRSVVLRGAGVVAVAAAAWFAAMPMIFDRIILAPCRPDFVTYRLLDRLAAEPVMTDAVEIVNIRLASQFTVHLATSFWLGVVTAFPIVLYLAWGFIAPGLYENEKRGAAKAFSLATILFYLGVAAGYFLIFPLTLRFLADYRVSDAIANHISLDSYIDNFLMLIFVMGLVFELPALLWLIGKTGIVRRPTLQRYRRHTVVALLTLSAVITPTGDPLTLMVVFLPIYLLWEAGIRLVPARADRQTDIQDIDNKQIEPI